MVDGNQKLPRRLSTADLVQLTGLSRHQIYRMKRRLRWGRFVYRGQHQAPFLIRRRCASR